MSTREVTALPTVSIVVPASNGHAVIERCLRAVVRQSVPAAEVLVVDNLSTDGTRGVVQRVIDEYPAAGIRLLRRDARQGLVPTRNRAGAVQAARGRRQRRGGGCGAATAVLIPD